MYCPRCSQERVTEQTSFCSRCGLYLDHLEEVIGNDGNPLFEPEESGSGRFLTRRRLRIFALFWFVIITIFFLPMVGITDGPEELMAMLGIIGPVGAITALILSFMIPKDAPAKKHQRTQNIQRSFPEQRSQRELPPERSVPAEEFARPSFADRDERSGYVPQDPPSVTEETTRHLDSKKPE
ncbi:MAG: hypothetical protein DWQ47_07095 [Acidobacteria bacterium]|nr:MAG: hypothetical protein DWQ32_15195 [Acidobacteriota bacterium]REJ99308.1 MAG: hypothetical protein DWQ38_14780 [Acidobacteriota bacterium]REK15972.1 MAG: hypothetical protein DWQ43_02905 [Acidobacteriota bacterium]REK43653.1 MAG: hypothetical protein DWQ47_07095 [Acidobacteriota bacterium]